VVRRRHVPQRTCVGCRQVRTKSDLVRIVRTPLRRVVLDVTGKLPGRGAYLCRNVRCLDIAVKQNRLPRALGVAVGGEVIEMARAELEQMQVPEAPERESNGT
jgi:hypothetical protein